MVLTGWWHVIVGVYNSIQFAACLCSCSLKQELEFVGGRLVICWANCFYDKISEVSELLKF